MEIRNYLNKYKKCTLKNKKLKFLKYHFIVNYFNSHAYKYIVLNESVKVQWYAIKCKK